MPNSSLFNLLRPTPPASSPAPAQNTPTPLQVSPQFRDWFQRYAQNYRGNPQDEIKRLNLTPQQDRQVRAMVSRLMPLMGGH